MIRPLYTLAVFGIASVAVEALVHSRLHLDETQERRAVPDSDVCKPPPEDQTLAWIWKDYGMDSYLNNFTQVNGWHNWANNMDAKTLNQDSVLFCTTVDSDSCAQPQAPCSSYKPPQAYHIRRAVANLHAMLRVAYHNLDAETILAFLALDQMIEDFGTPIIDATYDAAHQTSKILKIFSIVLDAIAPVAKQGEVVLALSSGALDLASEIEAEGTDSKADIRQGYKNALENTLSRVFTQAREGLQGLAASAFGADTPCHFPGSGGACGLHIKVPKTPVASIFSDGRYSLRPGQDPITSLPADTFDSGLKMMKQYLIGQLLKDLGDIVYVNQDETEADCHSGQGANRWINGECLILWDKNGAVDHGYQKLNEDTVDSYGIDLIDLYRSSSECQKHFPSYNGTADLASGRDSAGTLPLCFYNLPVLRTHRTICNIKEDVKHLPNVLHDLWFRTCVQRS